MAATAKVTTSSIDMNLWVVETSLEDIPELSPEWSTLDDLEQLSYDIEWPDMLGRFRSLIKLYENDVLTSEQRARYEAIVRRYSDVLGLIESMSLQTIPVPTLTARTH